MKTYLFIFCAMVGLASCSKKSTPAPHYVPDTTPGDITTFAGGGKNLYIGTSGPDTTVFLFYPTSVAVDAAGNVYIADMDHAVVRKVNTAGIVSTIAGCGKPGLSGDGGPATAATMQEPIGVAVDGGGNVYICDWFNNDVRKVDPSGIITTFAGNTVYNPYGDGGYFGDGGPAVGAGLNQPNGLAVDARGNVYIADLSNKCIRVVNAAGIISTFAGSRYKGSGFSGDGGPASAALLGAPFGVATDAAGNVYIADTYNQRIRKVDTAGIISTIAGNGYNAGVSYSLAGGFAGDGGPADSAELNLPYGVAVDASGNVYIADTYNQRVRKVSTSGIITTVAGNGYISNNGMSAPQNGGFAGNRGPAISAALNGPVGVAVDASGNIYIADQYNGYIRKVNN